MVSPRRAASWAARKSRSIPAVRTFADGLYRRRRAAFSDDLPEIDARDRPLLQTLERDAICMVPIAQLGWPGTRQMLDELDRLSGELMPVAGNPGNFVDISYRRLAEFPTLRDWGASPRARALAERYLGLPAFYDAPHIRREMRNGKGGGVRQWHLDTEDYRVLKLILYLEDVNSGGGPFQYMPLSDTERAVRSLRYSTGLIGDDRLDKAGVSAAAVEATSWRHTAIFVDAARLFHRAQPPVIADRFTATFCWISIYGHRDHHPHGRACRDIDNAVVG